MAELKINESEQVIRHVTAGERIWRTADDKLVAEGHPDALALYASEGKRIPREEAIRYGLVKPTADEKKHMAAAETEAEAAAPSDEGSQAPAKSANRADWNAYAEQVGIDPAEFSSKDDLIAAVEKQG